MRIEPFRSEASAQALATRLEKLGRTPLIVTGPPDRYDRVTHFVVWFAL
jgi:hypothetical protein